MWNQAIEQLSQDKYMAPLIKKWGRCTIKKTPSRLYFRSLVEAICSQQLSTKAASTIFKRLEEKLRSVDVKSVLDTSSEDLKSCGLSFSKVKYIQDLAIKVDSGKIKLQNLDNLSNEEVISSLTQVSGIGPWTCQMILMFDLGRDDVFPVDDLGISKAMFKITKKQMSKIQLLKFSERWKPYRTVASWYLWRSLENK